MNIQLDFEEFLRLLEKNNVRYLIVGGFERSRLDRNLFSSKGNVIQFGVEPVRIDLLNEIDGITFEEAEAHAVRGRYGKVNVKFIGKTELIKNKSATTRLKDKADVDELKEH